MAEYENFDRQYRLAIGKTGTDSAFEVGETSDDQPVPLHVTFSIEKSDTTTQNTGRVEVWNLNPTQVAALNEKDCALSLRAGYGNNMPLIFAGIVSFASTEMDGADRKTEIEVVDNLVEIRDTYVSVCYQGKVNWKTILDDVGGQIGTAVSYSYNAEFSDVANGFSFVGKAKDVLTKGCNCCGLSWSIQNGVLQIKKTGDVMSKEVYKLSAETGLLGIPVRVSISDSTASSTEGTSTENKKIGWDVDIFLNGAINVDDYVYLESKDVTGYFRVYSISHSGDNLSGDWISTARLLEVQES